MMWFLVLPKMRGILVKTAKTDVRQRFPNRKCFLFHVGYSSSSSPVIQSFKQQNRSCDLVDRIISWFLILLETLPNLPLLC